MTTAIIPVLAAMYLGSTFNLNTYQKGNADVFDPNELEGKLQVIDRSFTRSQYKLVETSTQAREFLDVSGALSLRIKKGDIVVDGTGAYLRDTANRQRFVELLVRVQHETVTETIPSHLQPKLDWMSMPPESVGSHFVRSITYGGELIASLRLRANNREERELIKAAVSANLQLTGTFDLNANGSFDKLRRDLAGMYHEEIKVMATKSPSSPPQTVEELMKLVEDYPKEISTINNGKGKALKAELYPLSSLKSDYPNYLPNSAVNSLLNDVETKYDDIRTVMQEIIPWNNKRLDSTEEDDEKVDEMYATLQAAQTAFHRAINNLDVSVKGKEQQFQAAFKAYGNGTCNVPNRFQRWFWKLRHEITKEPIQWDKPPGSGVAYISWGVSKCPQSTATTEVEQLYAGRASGPLARSWGGGRDFLCLPDEDPKQSAVVSPPPKPSLVDAVEFRSFTDPEKSYAAHCAACLVKGLVSVKTFYAKKDCPKRWRKEYSGVTMADSSSNVDLDFMCLHEDSFESVVVGLTGGNHLARLNPVWMSCEKCDGEKLVPCVVCSV